MKIPWSPERIAAGRARFAPLCDEAGLAYGERSHWYDSTLAHEALEWAKERGVADSFRRAIFQAYFVHDRNIGSSQVLAQIAIELGLDAADLRAALEERRYRGRVAAQYEQARAIGVKAVPTFIADGYAMVGLYPYQAFRELMAVIGRDPR